MPYIEVIQKYAVFEGRAKRTEFWLFALISVIISIVLGVLDAVILGSNPGEFQILPTLYGLAVLVPSLAVGCRRLHDSGKSGWLQLIFLIPLVGLIIMIVLFVLPSGDDNKHGPRPE